MCVWCAEHRTSAVPQRARAQAAAGNPYYDRLVPSRLATDCCEVQEYLSSRYDVPTHHMIAVWPNSQAGPNVCVERCKLGTTDPENKAAPCWPASAAAHKMQCCNLQCLAGTTFTAAVYTTNRKSPLQARLKMGPTSRPPTTSQPAIPTQHRASQQLLLKLPRLSACRREFHSPGGNRV